MGPRLLPITGPVLLVCWSQHLRGEYFDGQRSERCPDQNLGRLAISEFHYRSIISIPLATPSMVLPNQPLPRLPQIRMPNTSSASSSKCRHEHEDVVMDMSR